MNMYIICTMYTNNNIHDELTDDAEDDDDDDAAAMAGLPVEHPELGLEARRRHGLFGRAEARLHRAELPCTRLLNSHG